MKKDKSIYDKLSEERKKGQEAGEYPSWLTTGGYQLLKERYLLPDETLKGRYEEIAKAASRHMLIDSDKWNEKFFNLMWKGYLSPSTPILSSMGRKEVTGCPVACSGSYIGDNIYDFYDKQTEAAMLTKNGFGTSSYLGDIRPRGSDISYMKGKASGVLPVFKDFIQLANDVTQGASRRGAWAGYLPIDHGDFYEVTDYIKKYPDDFNIGWCISSDFIKRLDEGDKEALQRYQRSLKLKMITGKGYFLFTDKVNELNPEWYKAKGVKVKASNLCGEITLPSDDKETFTCVLSSLNISKYDEWKNTSTIFDSIYFLHCVALEFIEVGSKIKGLENAVRFTKKHMALGLGALGFHTYLQDNMLPFGSFKAHMKNIEIFKLISSEAMEASICLADEFGECDMTLGYDVANSHLTSIAPNLSTALICGGVSQGIEPVYKNAYIQNTAGGKVTRVNPSLLNLIYDRGLNVKEVIEDIIANNGSVQHASWLNDLEKEVFKTAFEINQEDIIRLASARQRYITQAQSINLFFSANESESYISDIHQKAFHDPYIKSLYYIRSETGIKAKNIEEVVCEACSG